MNQKRTMMIFLCVFFSVLGGIHYFLWWQLIHQPAWPHPWQLGLTLLFVALGVGLPLLRTVFRHAEFVGAGQWLLGGLYLWLGFVFFAFWLCLAAVLARAGLQALVGISVETPIFGLLFDPRIFSVAVGTTGLSACLLAMLIARQGPVIETVDVQLERFPKSLQGYRIAQISDLHVAPFLGADYVQTVIDRTNQLNPDLVVITGDLVDGSVARFGATVRLLKNLQNRDGIYFVTGNHEYYSGADAWLAVLTDMGVRVLRNEHVQITRDGQGFVLAGVDDWTAHHFVGHGADLEKALAGCASDQPIILLAHQPLMIRKAAERKVDLMLSGHTHGGQMWPFGYLVRLAQPYLRGLSRHSPSTQIYVNRGTGYWGPPLRLGATPEITLLRVF